MKQKLRNAGKNRRHKDNVAAKKAENAARRNAAQHDYMPGMYELIAERTAVSPIVHPGVSTQRHLSKGQVVNIVEVQRSKTI